MNFLEHQTIPENKITLIPPASIDDDVSRVAQLKNKDQFGDTYILEEDIKDPLEISHSIIEESPRITESTFIDGQGDLSSETISESSITDQLITSKKFSCQIETIKEPEKITDIESTCILQRMIKQMERDASEAEILHVSAQFLNPAVKDEIENWEESQEEVIRIITGTDIDKIANCQDDDELSSEEVIDEMHFVGELPELHSELLLPSKKEYVEEIVIEELESVPYCLEIEKSKALPSPLLQQFSLSSISDDCQSNIKNHYCETQKSGKLNKWFNNFISKLFHLTSKQNKHQ